jgi:anthranilate phosphoribosyltransferase
MKVPERVRNVLYDVTMGVDDIDCEDLAAAFEELLAFDDARIRAAICASLSAVLLQRGPRTSEVVALLRVVIALDGLDAPRPRADTVEGRGRVVTVMGSGKKGVRCINISTPSALVAAACGGAIAKVGANCTSRITSSIEFARAVGVNVDMPTDEMLGVLAGTGFGYFRGGDARAPRFFETYKGICVAPHALMFGWPILSPLQTPTILYGLSHPNVRVSAEVLAALDIADAVVVSTSDGPYAFDEVLPLGDTHVAEVRGGAINHYEIDAAALLGQSRGSFDQLTAQASPSDDIRTTMRALAGDCSPSYGAALALNAAYMLLAGDPTIDVKETARQCHEVASSGAALEKLRDVVIATEGSIADFNFWAGDH